jgi:Mn-containing catalase
VQKLSDFVPEGLHDSSQVRSTWDTFKKSDLLPAGRLIPEARKYLAEGVHRRLYRFSPSDYHEIEAIWGGGESALPGDPPGELVVLDGPPEGGKIHDLTGTASAFTPDYAPEEMFEIATKLYKKAKNL